MAGLPPYLARVNPGAGAVPPRPVPPRPTVASDSGRRVKRSAPQTQGPSKRRMRTLAQAEASKPAPMPSKEVVTEAARKEVVIAATRSPSSEQNEPTGEAPLSPDRSLVPPPPPPPVKNQLRRGVSWEKGVIPEMSVAFLPPHRFQDINVPLTDAEERLVHSVQHGLAQGIGLVQSYLLLKHQLVSLSGQKRRVEGERDAAISAREVAEGKLKAVETDRDEVKGKLEVAESARGEAEEKLRVIELEMKESKVLVSNMAEERDRAQGNLTQTASELQSVKSSYNECLAALKTVQIQRGSLAEDLGEAKSRLDDLERDHASCSSTIARTAKDAFEMALSQVRFWNPEVPLDLGKCHFRAYVYEGKFHPPRLLLKLPLVPARMSGPTKELLR